jgi:hypothetical protein
LIKKEQKSAVFFLNFFLINIQILGTVRIRNTGAVSCKQNWALSAYTVPDGSVVGSSVVDPDPPDPHVFGPSGSGSTSQRYGSGSFYHHAKIVRKTLIPTILLIFFDFLSLKNDVNVPSKSNKQKKLC